MKVYATTGLMEVVCGVFRTISEAKAHLDSNAFGPNPQILTCDVIGPLDEPETVFTLSRLDLQAGVHTFAGKVYGSYEEALRAAGGDGLVQGHQL